MKPSVERILWAVLAIAVFLHFSEGGGAVVTPDGARAYLVYESGEQSAALGTTIATLQSSGRFTIPFRALDDDFEQGGKRFFTDEQLAGATLPFVLILSAAGVRVHAESVPADASPDDVAKVVEAWQ